MMPFKGLLRGFLGRFLPIDCPEAEHVQSVRRIITWIERAGWLLFLVELLLPQFDGPRALLTWPLFRPSLHYWLFGYLVALRIAILTRTAAKVVRPAALAAAVLLAAAIAEWFVFTPALQGPSRYEGTQWAIVLAAGDGGLDLQLENGLRVRAKNDWAARYGIKPGQCRQVEIMHGRFGVRWLEFYPQLSCVLPPKQPSPAARR